MATNTKVNAIILCGGEGTRVKDISGGVPKCVMEVGGKPFLFHLLHQLYRSGVVDRVILAAGDKGAQINEIMAKGAGVPGPRIEGFMGMDVFWAEEWGPRGTLFGMLSALPYVNSDYILIMNGDTLCLWFDFRKFLIHSLNSKQTLVIAEYKGHSSGVWYVDTIFLHEVWDIYREFFLSGQKVDREFLLHKLSSIKPVWGTFINPLTRPTSTGSRLIETVTVDVGYFQMDMPFIDIGTVSGYEKAINEIKWEEFI
jgi:NDP-sugar pyrophosphorylase family protein